MVEEIFLSPQVKRSPIISNKYGIYGLLHKLSKDFRLRILGNLEISGKFPNFIELPSKHINVESTLKQR